MALIQRLRILHGKLHKERIILKGMTHRAVTTQNQDADDYPIDFVVTWVDGNDQAWREEKEQYWSRIHGGEVSIKGNGFERYRDWDQFMYWFRAVEMYAPWVRYVYLVTWGHVPKWLNLNHPKLRIIKHPDYIDREYLPTFQSIPIEINLHRINDLSEHFVYFNDDQLLTSPVLPVDFFVGGVPKHCAIAYPVRNYAYNGPFAHQQFSFAMQGFGCCLSILLRVMPQLAIITLSVISLRIWKRRFRKSPSADAPLRIAITGTHL